jgi:hypothetical protein
MNLRKCTAVVPCALISALAITASIASARGTQTQPPPGTSAAAERTIRGVWRTAVTPRNCQTGAAILTLSGLFTFNQGGTMAEYGIGPGSSPALRSPGHGLWEREHGWQDYSFVFTFYRYNASGAFLGSQKVSATLELGAGGDAFTSRSSIETLDVDGVVIGTGCATAVGTRFE